MARREPYGRITGPAGDHLASLVALHPTWHATEIHAQLTRDVGTELGDRIPSLRTVQREVGKIRQESAAREPETTAAWRIVDFEADDTVHVIEVLRSLPHVDAADRWPTKRHAEMIALIKRIAPEIPRAIDVYHLALFAQDGGLGLELVSACLASAPWSSPSASSGRAAAFWSRLQAWDDQGRWVAERDPELVAGLGALATANGS